ncbi:MAG: penicillin-binding protein 2 [Schwartzia succinivorans]|nr:penicillin-binding protein 2 [Schwartzia succinivorans]
MVVNEYENRLRILGCLVILIIVILVARVGYLQVYDGEKYARLADGNRIRLIPTMAPRGTFYDRNGNNIVTNRPGFTVSLLPLTGPISPDVISRLSSLLNISEEEIKSKIESHVGFEPIRIKNDVGPEIRTIIAEQKNLYPGVVIEVQAVRDYLYKERGAHVLGYVSEISDSELESKKEQGYKTGDIIGKFGLEKIYDQQLRGSNGGRQVEVDVTGKPVQILGRKDAIAGNDLVLTIDWKLQLAAEQAVDAQLKLIGAHAAAAVVMNPQTGEVLALVSRPAFDPNLFVHGISEKDWKTINDNPYFPLDNKAITGEYPPGSTFKIVTGTAALTEGVITPYEQIFDSGTYWLGEKGNADGEALGWLNFSQALAHSDNVYFYELGYRLGVDRLEHYARMFGLGAKTGINLPFESEGLVANKAYKEKVFEEDWYISETLDAAIGQGFNLVTPLQAAMVMGEIAADGRRYQPYLVQRIVGPDGKTIQEFQPKLLSTLEVPSDVIREVQNGLRDVTKIGTAASIFGPNFPIDLAGKTGTAENPQGKDHGWFVAYGPFQNPNIVIAVIVENGGYGSQSAVPIGKKIIEAAFGLNNPVSMPK